MSIGDLTDILGLGALILISVLSGGFWILNVRIGSLLAMISELERKVDAHAIDLAVIKSIFPERKGHDD